MNQYSKSKKRKQQIKKNKKEKKRKINNNIKHAGHYPGRKVSCVTKLLRFVIWKSNQDQQTIQILNMN